MGKIWITDLASVTIEVDSIRIRDRRNLWQRIRGRQQDVDVSVMLTPYFGIRNGHNEDVADKAFMAGMPLTIEKPGDEVTVRFDNPVIAEIA